MAIQASSGSSADVVMNKSRKRKANDLQNASVIMKEKLQSTPATRDRGYVEPLKKFLEEFSSATQKETPKVCLLGYANVGKSSIINALRGKDVAETGFAGDLPSSFIVWHIKSSISSFECPVVFIKSLSFLGIVSLTRVKQEGTRNILQTVLGRRCMDEQLGGGVYGDDFPRKVLPLIIGCRV